MLRPDEREIWLQTEDWPEFYWLPPENKVEVIAFLLHKQKDGRIALNAVQRICDGMGLPLPWKLDTWFGCNEPTREKAKRKWYGVAPPSPTNREPQPRLLPTSGDRIDNGLITLDYDLYRELESKWTTLEEKWRLVRTVEQAGESEAVQLEDKKSQDRVEDQNADVEELSGRLGPLSSGSGKAYLEESLACLRSGYYRAAVVLAWCALSLTLWRHLWHHHRAALHAALDADRRHPLTKAEDLSEISDSQIIRLARDIGALDRDAAKSLAHLLDQRNACAHASTRVVTRTSCLAFFHEIVYNVLPKLK